MHIETKKRPERDVLHPESQKESKKARLFFPSTEGPTTSEFKNVDKGIVHHAYMRIQILLILFHGYYKKAVRTNGDKVDVQVTFTGATMQVGRGNRENHAAHSNPIARPKDNLKSAYIDQIIEDHDLTPQKKDVLSHIVSPISLRRLQNPNINREEVVTILNRFWKESLFEGSDWEVLSNATDKLPRSVNLSVDLPLEIPFRPHCAELLRLVMRGEMTPHEAIQNSVEFIQSHFKKKIIELEQASTKSNSLLEIQKIKLLIQQHQLELEGTVIPPEEYLLPEFYEKKEGKAVFNSKKVNQLLVRTKLVF